MQKKKLHEGHCRSTSGNRQRCVAGGANGSLGEPLQCTPLQPDALQPTRPAAARRRCQHKRVWKGEMKGLRSAESTKKGRSWSKKSTRKKNKKRTRKKGEMCVRATRRNRALKHNTVSNSILPKLKFRGSKLTFQHFTVAQPFTLQRRACHGKPIGGRNNAGRMRQCQGTDEVRGNR